MQSEKAFDRQGIGGNLPPATLRDRLALDHAPLAEEVENLAAKANAAPKIVDSDQAANLVGDLIKEIAAEAKRVNGTREAEKEPFLKGGREVDGFFKAFSDRLDRMKDGLQARITAFLRAKAAEARRLQEEEANRLRFEAEQRRLEAEQAAKAGRMDDAQADMREAIAAEDGAHEASLAASSKPADLARTRSDSGTLSTLKATWTFEIADWDSVDLTKLRPHLKRDDVEKAIRRYVQVGGRELAGVRIFQDEHAVIR